MSQKLDIIKIKLKPHNYDITNTKQAVSVFTKQWAPTTKYTSPNVIYNYQYINGLHSTLMWIWIHCFITQYRTDITLHCQYALFPALHYEFNKYKCQK